MFTIVPYWIYCFCAADRMYHDERGLACTTDSLEAVRLFDQAVRAYLGFRRDTGNHLKAVLAADPDFALAHCLRGYFFMLFARRPLAGKARQCLATAEEATTRRGASERERRHFAALDAWTRGHLERAVAAWESILADSPRDVLALRLAHFMHFYLGDSQRMRDSTARILPAWDPRVPGHGFVLGIHAFGLEESGDYEPAERVGRRAVEANPKDIWAAHAVAHVMEMQNRHREGIAWITDLASNWSGCNNFAYHVWWHRALFHLELENYDTVLDLYDREIRADKSEEYLDICNAASLLWRLECAGVEVGARWRELAEKAEPMAQEHMLIFADLHYAMCLAAGGLEMALAGMVGSMRRYASQSEETEARVAEQVGIPLCEALFAFRRGEYQAALDLMMPFRYRIHRVGGSHAQRDIFERLLILSAFRAERFDIARMLLAERTVARPKSPWTWKTYASVLDALHFSDQATEARGKAAVLLAS